MAAPNPRAARERKQKIFVAVGGLLLVALLAIQLPKLLGGSSTTEAAATAETTTDGTTSVPTPTAARPDRHEPSYVRTGPTPFVHRVRS